MADNWAPGWVADKMRIDAGIIDVTQIADGLLYVTRSEYKPFNVAAISIEGKISKKHITGLFLPKGSPDFVVNVPTEAIWTGEAIKLIHKRSAAFGGMGDLSRASRLEEVSSYRFKQYQFVETGIRQHSHVSHIDRIYDRKFLVHRHDLPDLMVVLVDAYQMSAEDVRSARDRYGRFDVALKMTSYGKVTTAARDAADSMGAQAFLWGDLMKRLREP